MASYLKPQSPILCKENYIYPLTTYDQIIMPDGSRWNGEASNGNYTETDPTVPAWAKESNPPTYTKNDVGLGNVDNVRQYSADNPPPYPVLSVNGQTGNVELYPVGSVYISTSSTSPASLFGGTWEQIKDRFLLGAGDSYMAGSTGGEAMHTLTTAEMPSHYHNMAQEHPTSGNTSLPMWHSYFTYNADHLLLQKYDESQNIKAYTVGTSSMGGNGAHNNMPPYLTVYMWRRVA